MEGADKPFEKKKKDNKKEEEEINLADYGIEEEDDIRFILLAERVESLSKRNLLF